MSNRRINRNIHAAIYTAMDLRLPLPGFVYGAPVAQRIRVNRVGAIQLAGIRGTPLWSRKRRLKVKRRINARIRRRTTSRLSAPL